MGLMLTSPSGDWWPTHPQLLLLQTAYSPTSVALEAWRAWQALAVPIERLDEGSARLLPLVYYRLRDLPGVTAPGWLREIYRRTWYKNQQLANQAAALLESLHSLGFPTLVLKGLALIPLYYHQWGLRPMADFDVLVPTAQAEAVFAALDRLGWQCAQSRLPPAALFAVKQAVDFSNPAGAKFDLHWHTLWNNCYPGADEAFWQAAVPVQIKHVSTLALNPTDQLLHVCVHGAGLNQVPPVRWAADAMQILTAPGVTVDWPRLVQLAGQLQLSLPLVEGLRYLCTALAAPVPSAVLNQLEALPTSWHARRMQWHRGHQRGLLGELPLMWHHYAYQNERTARRSTPLGFISYLRRYYDLHSVSQVVAFIFNKAKRRVRAVGAAR